MPDEMLAAVYQGKGTVTVERVPVPEPGRDEILLEVSHCGICGSDMHLVLEEWGRPGSVHGHEYSGVVVAVGDGVTTHAVGDRVVGGPRRGCGECKPCRSGRSNVCVLHNPAGLEGVRGAFARFKALPAEAAYPVPDALDLRTAALSEPVAVALRGVRRSHLEAGDRALVTGGGPIGLLTIAVLKAQGIDDITVSEPLERRRNLAVRVGARVAVTPDALQAPPMPMDIVDAPFDAAIECSGRAEAMDAALAQLAKGGTLVLSGTGMVRPKFDPIRIILNELTITGSIEYTPGDFIDAIALIASGALPTRTLIEDDDVTLGSVRIAMEQLAAGDLAGKVMVVPNA